MTRRKKFLSKSRRIDTLEALLGNQRPKEGIPEELQVIAARILKAARKYSEKK